MATGEVTCQHCHYEGKDIVKTGLLKLAAFTKAVGNMNE